MRKEHPLITVARILDARRPVDRGAYILYAKDKKIRLCKEQNKPNGYRTILRLISRDINDGLTMAVWDRADARIRKLRKEGIL